MQWQITAIALVGTAVLYGAWWLWWRLPQRQADRLRLMIRDPKARADVEDNFRKTISQLFGGAAVLIGAGIAYVQFTQQQQSAHDLLISNQVSKGFEQLGSEKLVVRLGGIYALEGVMNTSEQYHRPVLEALCAFVRDGTRSNKDDGPPAADIQATLTVIGRRKGIDKLNLADVHIPGALLDDANLPGANLSGANLSGANLSRAHLFVSDLRGAHLSSAHLVGANISGADLNGADLSRAWASFANLSGANLSGANLSRAELSGANLSRANLPSANLTGANLSGANLSGANLRRARLFGTDLSGAKITQTQLDTACGDDVKLDPGLTIRPCSRAP